MKRNETIFSKQPISSIGYPKTNVPLVPINRPHSRQKRHADFFSSKIPITPERKTRKRRTIEKTGASVVRISSINFIYIYYNVEIIILFFIILLLLPYYFI